MDTIEVVRNALSNANATIHGQGAVPSHSRGGAAPGGRPAPQSRAPGSGGGNRPTPATANPLPNGRSPRGANPTAPYR